MIDKATLTASIAAAAGQAGVADRAPAPSASKGVQADAFRLPAKVGEEKAAPLTVRQTADGPEGVLRIPPVASDLWRSRFDAETLKMFTEVVHPVTRDPIYRVPAGSISEEAERKGEELAREERLEREIALVV
jgi:hypothetical protein